MKKYLGLLFVGAMTIVLGVGCDRGEELSMQPIELNEALNVTPSPSLFIPDITVEIKNSTTITREFEVQVIVPAPLSGPTVTNITLAPGQSQTIGYSLLRTGIQPIKVNVAQGYSWLFNFMIDSSSGRIVFDLPQGANVVQVSYSDFEQRDIIQPR